MVKRLFDIVAAGLGLLVLWPLLAIVAILIAAERQGPVLIRQNRVGRNARPFRFVKFRTLPQDTPERPTHEIDTHRTSPTGLFVRRTKLDELPQLVHVLFGQMSLVGPRPSLVSQDALIAARRTRGVLDLRPGITGLAQVNGIDMSNPERLARVDALYARRHSLCLDLKLIALTVLAVFRPVRRAARRSRDRAEHR